MTINAADVKKLRDRTGAGIMDAKAALEEASGDVTAAIALLKKKGQKVALKKQDRATSEGWVATYTHATGKIGSMVALTCETDFVARNEQFQKLAHHIALHIAAANPQYLKPEDIPEDVLATERSAIEAEAKERGKPAPVVKSIVEGKLQKFYSEQCLLQQPFVMDEDTTIGELVTAAVQQLGENIEIREFSRFTL